MDNKKQIGIFNQKSNYFYNQAKLKTQASKKYFYGKDGKIEDWLASIETIVAPIFHNYLAKEILPQRESEIHIRLIFFLILLDLRNPMRLNQFIKSRELLIERIVSKNPEFVNSDLVKEIRETIEKEKSVKTVVTMANDIVPICLDLEYKLLKNMTKNPFIISDYPLVKYNQFLEMRKWNNSGHNGYGTIGLQIYLPINSQYTLILFDSNVYKVGNKKEKIVEIDEEKSIDQLNLLQCLNCDNNLFFNEKASKFYIEKLHERALKIPKSK